MLFLLLAGNLGRKIPIEDDSVFGVQSIRLTGAAPLTNLTRIRQAGKGYL
jgi:hypothetical protein